MSTKSAPGAHLISKLNANRRAALAHAARCRLLPKIVRLPLHSAPPAPRSRESERGCRNRANWHTFTRKEHACAPSYLDIRPWVGSRHAHIFFAHSERIVRFILWPPVPAPPCGRTFKAAVEFPQSEPHFFFYSDSPTTPGTNS